MFKRLSVAERNNAKKVTLIFEHRELSAFEGDSLAAALLASGLTACRTTPLSGSPRAPYCMTGVCFECLMNVEGIPNVQACQVPVHDGMKVCRQQGARSLDT